MTLADIVAVMSDPDRVRITKGSNELFAGYLGNLVHMAEYEALMAEVGNYRFGHAKSPKVIEAVRENTKAACLEKSRKNKESEE